MTALQLAIENAPDEGGDDFVAQSAHWYGAQADLDVVDPCNRTLLHFSRFNSNVTGALRLLAANANAWAESDYDGVPMEWIFKKECTQELSDLLLQQSPSEHGLTALMLAASRGYDHTIPKLLEMGEDPELEDKNGMTALMMAMMPREEEEDWQAEGKANVINLLRGDRTNAELNEMRRVLWFPEVPPPLNLPD